MNCQDDECLSFSFRPLLARFGKCPGILTCGCAIGGRPVDIHLSNLEKMGARMIELENGYINAEANNLKGAQLDLFLFHLSVLRKPYDGRRFSRW